MESRGGKSGHRAFGNLWTSQRSRLLVGRAAMLTFIYYNSRVLSMQPTYDMERLFTSLPPVSFDAQGFAIDEGQWENVVVDEGEQQQREVVEIEDDEDDEDDEDYDDHESE